MKTKLKYLLPIILLVACTQKEKKETTPAPLFPQPKTVDLNTSGGYILNQLTGDSIQPIIKSNGDTLITGYPYIIIGAIVNTDSLLKVKPSTVLPLIELTTNNAHPNRYKVPTNLTIIPVNHDSLTVIKIEKNDTTHYIINTIGDTVKTGVKIPIKGNIVTTIHPKPIKAGALRFSDLATENIKTLGTDEGMLSAKINTIFHDKNGNIWFGLYNAGLSKYNGESFAHFTEKEGLSSNSINSIIEDKKGNIWIGTDKGVNMYNGNSFTHFTEKEGLSSNSINSIIEDQEGNLWFGTAWKGISKYDGKSIIHYTEKEGLSSNAIKSIIQDEKKNIWIGTFRGGINKYNGESFTHFIQKDESSNIISTILEDKKGNIWFGTWGGLYKYNGKSFTHFTEKEGLSHHDVRSIAEDKNGDIWFGTTKGGVSKYDGVNFTHFTKEEGLSSNSILSIIEDRAGVLWFGTMLGANRYDKNSFKHFTEKEGLTRSSILSIFEDSKKNYWFGTLWDGLYKYDGNSFIHFTEKQGLSGVSISSIIEDEDGTIWFTTDGGIDKYDGISFTNFWEKNGLSDDGWWSTIKDNSGNFWFWSYNGGINKYDGNLFTHFTEKEGLSCNGIRSIVEDKKGQLWFGTTNSGICMYDGAKFTNFTEKEGLSNNNVGSIMEDKKGNLWIGTEGGGLNMYDGKSFIHFTKKEGLSSNSIRSIIEDNNGTVWISTDNGLNKLTVVIDKKQQLSKDLRQNENETRYKIVSYLKHDGLNEETGFFQNSIYLDSKSQLWLGNNSNLLTIDIGDGIPYESKLDVFLTQLDINEQFFDYRNITDSLANEIRFSHIQNFNNYPINLELPYHKNHLTFYFAAIDWKAPHKIQYSYIMEGLNTKWSQPTSEAKADYRNLPYGTFTFTVKAIGESGEWSESFQYTFTITPPWWHTWWARSVYVVVTLSLIFGVVRWRITKLKKRQQELETEVKNATHEIRQQKEVVERQKEKVEEAHKEITDSIDYAERIQRSFLATKEVLDTNLKDYFVFFKPKNVVSGDFYWADLLSNGTFAVVNADSTGHGVPGAIMSILNISSIEGAVKEGSTTPNEIFNKTRQSIIKRLKKDGSPEGGKDGMDASIVCFDFENKKLTYTAAQNPIWIIRDGNLTEIKPEKMPVGKHDLDHMPFEGGEFDLQTGDQIYTLTDGFQDQFGGAKGKKFMVKKMREYILSISHLSMNEQHQRIKEVFANWKGDLEQVDDVCVIGVRI